jgi:hypothetical protein
VRPSAHLSSPSSNEWAALSRSRSMGAAPQPAALSTSS